MTNPIHKIITAFALSTTLCAATEVSADMQSIDISNVVEQAAPMEAKTLNLGDYTAVVYYTKMTNGNFMVVTTVGPNIDVDGAITQHQIELAPGQRYTMNIEHANHSDVALRSDVQ